MNTLTPDTDDTLPRNTNNRGKVWGPNTWNNYTDDDYDYLVDYLSNNCDDYVLQKEVGKEGTPHIQFCMRYANARTFKSIKNQLPKVHLEKAKNWNAVKNYCNKEDSCVGGKKSKQKRSVKDPLEGKEPKEVQQLIIDMVAEEPDDRTINWVVDVEGNYGKTTVAKHLCIKYPNQVLYLGGKASDIKYGIFKFLQNEKNDLKICIFDFTRSVENFISYQAIEECKNGIFYNTKYESEMCIYDPPHIVIFANFHPDLDKLSLDRWNIIDVSIGLGGPLDCVASSPPVDRVAGGSDRLGSSPTAAVDSEKIITDDHLREYGLL